MKKGTKLYSLLTETCPKCHEGKVFIYKNPYNLAHFTEMHGSCPKCGQSFRPEPGFYYGAGYVSYALGVALVVTLSVGMSFWIPFFKNFELYATVNIGATILLAPIMFRQSRVGWLNFFFKYDPKAVENHELAQRQRETA